jgi:hypothetical protein
MGAQFTPSVLVAMKPFSPTVTNRPPPNATPRSHWLKPTVRRVQLTPSGLV